MAKIDISATNKRRLQRNGALVLPLDGAETQDKATYYNRYGDAMVLPADPRSLHFYLKRGLTLTKPARPRKRPVDNELAATQADWDGRKTQVLEGASPEPQDFEAALAASPSFQALSSQLSELTDLLKRALGVQEEPKPAPARRRKAS